VLPFLQDEKYLYFIYEYVQRGTLSKLIKKFERERLPIDLAIFYTAELVHTLEYLHNKGVIHRDLKP
jgi:serine/threonine protein kinase